MLPESSKIKECKGVVAWLDFLGAQSWSREKRMRWLDLVSQFAQKIRKDLADTPSEEKKIFVFQDTISISLSLSDQYNLPTTLHLCEGFFGFFFQHNFLLRGAIGYGDFIVCDDPDIIVGDVVHEISQEYEKARWGGIHLTPSAQKIWEEDQKRLEGEIEPHARDHDINRLNNTVVSLSNSRLSVVPYRVECKCKGNTFQEAEIPCLNWPIRLLQEVKVNNNYIGKELLFKCAKTRDGSRLEKYKEKTRNIIISKTNEMVQEITDSEAQPSHSLKEKIGKS